MVGPAPGAEPSDGRLLERFAYDRDEAAFADLVQRYGPLVVGVCRRLLGHQQDAEDAFQAAFLVLARKAATLDRRGSVAGYLYTVAYRLALRARAMAVKDLEQLGEQASPALGEAQAGTPSPEVRKQAEGLLAGMRLVRFPDQLRRLRAIAVLERIGSPEARRVLDDLARGAPAARETQDARAALARLEGR